MRLGVAAMAPLIIGAAAGLTVAPGAAQELRLPCDADRDGAVTTEGAQGCAERRFERARAGDDGVALDQFAAAYLDADGLREQFAQIDEDGDGRISREEWMRSFGPARAGDATGADGRAIGTE